MKRPTDRRSFVKGVAIGATGIFASGASSVLAAPKKEISERFLGVFDRACALNLEFAEKMPADKYDFRPVPEIRTYAEQLLHASGSSVFFTGYLGGKGVEFNLEPENPTKEMVIDLMQKSDEYARSVIKEISDEQMTEVVETFAGPLSKEAVCWFMRDHMTHTRGQMVIYLRLNGLEPPSYVGI